MIQNPSYPLGEHEQQSIHSAGERPFEAVNLSSLMSGHLSPQDLRIHADTLLAQADIARQAGFGKLAENLSRAAELTRIPDSLLLAMYEALRPGRSTGEQLSQLAEQLEDKFAAPRCAEFVRQAEDNYRRRGLLRNG